MTTLLNIKSVNNVAVPKLSSSNELKYASFVNIDRDLCMDFRS